MPEKDIYQEGNVFIIKKEINGNWIDFGNFNDIDEAIARRDELEEYGWPCTTEEKSIKKIEKHIYQEEGRFLVYNIIDNKEIIFGSFDNFKKAKSFKRKLLEYSWNVNFASKLSEYGKYVLKEGNKFVIRKSVDGVPKRYGVFKNLDEALVVRDSLIENNWNMSDDRILSNLGIEELKGKDENIGKIGRSYTVFKWDGSRCTLFGFFNNHRDAVKVRDKLSKSYWNSESAGINFKDTKHIVKVGNSYRISKMISGELNHFGHYKTLEEAIEIRDKLIENNWDKNIVNIPKRPDFERHIHKSSRGFRVVNRINGELVDFGIFDNLDEAISYRDNLEENNWVIDSDEDEFTEEKYDEFIFLRNDGKYYIKNEINGVMYIFGVFDNPLDAIAARLDCMKNQWELVSISEEEYFANPNANIKFGSLDDEEEDITEETIYSNITDECIGFPVTVGKSYKNKGWAVKRSHLESFVPRISYEKECIFLVEGFEVVGKANIHTRLFYFQNNELSEYLKKLSDIDDKTQTRIDLDLDHGIYSVNSNLEGKFLKFKTKFSKSFRKGMFVMSRNLSKVIIPVLPCESNCTFSVSGLDASGKFNLEFRIRFRDDSLIEYLDTIKEENDSLDIILML